MFVMKEAAKNVHLRDPHEFASWGSDENKNGTVSTCHFTTFVTQTEHARPVFGTTPLRDTRRLACVLQRNGGTGQAADQ